MAGIFGPTDVPEQYQSLIQAASVRWGVPPELLAAQIEAESSFNPNAVSSAGAIGIAQFMPDTAESLGVNPRDPKSAIDGMARLMSRYFKEFGSWDKALVAYHDGPGGVGDPSNNAQNYVRKILGKIGNAVTDVIPSPLNPVENLSNLVTLIQKLKNPEFLRRVGLGALGVGVIVLGLVLLFRGTVGASVGRMVKDVTGVENKSGVGNSRNSSRSNRVVGNGDRESG